MTTVACVLRSGGIYTSDWVHALKRGLDRHAGVPFRFKCLTDLDVPGVECIPLEHDWPGWWAKLELLNPRTFDGPVVYMDLDTLPVGDLSGILGYRGRFAMLTDFGRPIDGQSGMMAWTPSHESAHVWKRFMANPGRGMQQYLGDGQFIYAHARQCERLQTLFPGQIVSLKLHARAGIPEGVRVVCDHGTTKFSDMTGWSRAMWQSA